MATAKTSKSTVTSVNKNAVTSVNENAVTSVNERCDELENIVSALESRIAELETNLNTDTSTSSSEDGWKNKIEEIIKIMPDGEWACIKKGL